MPENEFTLLGYPARAYVEIDLPNCQMRLPVKALQIDERGGFLGPDYGHFRLEGDIRTLYDAHRAGLHLAP
jgi:hypothetical protein